MPLSIEELHRQCYINNNVLKTDDLIDLCCPLCNADLHGEGEGHDGDEVHAAEDGGGQGEGPGQVVHRRQVEADQPPRPRHQAAGQPQHGDGHLDQSEVSTAAT